jgi:hypothetical protein
MVGQLSLKWIVAEWVVRMDGLNVVFSDDLGSGTALKACSVFYVAFCDLNKTHVKASLYLITYALCNRDPPGGNRP